jgi:hypothetical protein
MAVEEAKSYESLVSSVDLQNANPLGALKVGFLFGFGAAPPALPVETIEAAQQIVRQVPEIDSASVEALEMLPKTNAGR